MIKEKIEEIESAIPLTELSDRGVSLMRHGFQISFLESCCEEMIRIGNFMRLFP